MNLYYKQRVYPTNLSAFLKFVFLIIFLAFITVFLDLPHIGIQLNNIFIVRDHGFRNYSFFIGNPLWNFFPGEAAH